jgi:hypothetical protein
MTLLVSAGKRPRKCALQTHVGHRARSEKVPRTEVGQLVRSRHSRRMRDRRRATGEKVDLYQPAPLDQGFNQLYDTRYIFSNPPDYMVGLPDRRGPNIFR